MFTAWSVKSIMQQKTLFSYIAQNRINKALIGIN